MDYFFSKEDLFCKVKSILTSFHGIILWTSPIQSSPMQNTKVKTQCSFDDMQAKPGLKILIHFPTKPNNYNQYLTHNSTLATHSYLPPPSPSTKTTSDSRCPSSSVSKPCPFSSSFDDLIGTENGVHMDTCEDQELNNILKQRVGNRRCCNRRVKQNQQRSVKEHEYPPPIPSLARNMDSTCYMPWALSRRYDNGRLILAKERVKHVEYFEVLREDNRLILTLVCVDHDDYEVKDGASIASSKNTEEELLDNSEDLVIDEEDEETQDKCVDEDEDLFEAFEPDRSNAEVQKFEDRIVHNSLPKLWANDASAQVASTVVMIQLCSSLPNNLVLSRKNPRPMLTTFG